MCGVLRTNSRESELVVAPQEAAGMPPSVTYGEAESSKATQPVTEISSEHLEQHQGAASNKDIPTIDLAADENDDLQKAIALSLQEQTDSAETTSLAGISAEDQDVSKALEVSLQENSSSTTIDIINPNERKRLLGIPVGLKNIGNSCWFNVVIQSLFFIPAFRDLIINYPKDINGESSLSKTSSKLLVPVLRHLFSLLIGSERKYIDPSEAVKLFQGQDMRKNTQQDVCEFIHKLLEKLEEEFKLMLKKQGLEKECSEFSSFKDSDFENPIMKLFYGQFREGDSEDSEESKLETFGQFILTVMRYKDIHESILASMAGGIAEENVEAPIKPTEQNRWFKTLPSVLIFSLSRYEYSKEKKRAEKVHNKFDFPEYLFMDRYMEVNKDEINKKHIKIAEIKQELKLLYNILEKYEKFGSRESKYPIADILKYTLEFALNARKGDEIQNSMEVDSTDVTANDVEMFDIKDDKPNEIPSSVHNSSKMFVESTKECCTTDKLCHNIPNKKSRTVPPSPQSVNPTELAILQTCLPRWQREVELKVNTLKKSIDDLEGQLILMYEEPNLQRVPYKLHAVVVHEGQASGGHYWVYIFDSFKSIWMKFNDNQITESNWQEVMCDSIGGQNNASAYCLMYVDQTRYTTLFSNYKSSLDNWPSYLSIDLQECVKQDNLAFMSELEQWELSSQKSSDQDSRAVPATAPNSPDILNVDEDESSFFLEIQTMLSQTLSKAFQSDDIISQGEFMSSWITKILTSELSRLKDTASQRVQNPYSEPSILDLGIYLTKNNQKDILLHWYAFEIVWQISQRENTRAMNMLHDEAVKCLHKIREKYLSTMGAIYKGWKRHYQTLVTCTWHFICGYRKFQARQFDVALVYMTLALKFHGQIRDSPPLGKAKTLDYRILGYCYRKCLLIVNDRLVDTFINAESEDKAFEEAQTVIRLIVPALWYVNNSNESEDETAGDMVRNKWCMLIGSIADKAKAHLVKQIIEQITSDSGDGSIHVSVKIPSIPAVLSLYKEYADVSNMIMASYNKKDAQISDL